MEVDLDFQPENGDPPPRNKSTNSCASLLAHDTRNWLTVLQMYCDLLRTYGAKDARFPDWIQELSAAVDRGQALVASLLESARSCHVKERKPKPETSPFSAHSRNRGTGGCPPLASSLDLGAVIAGRLAILQQMAGTKVRISLHIETETARAAVAESDFDRILQNLAWNAIEAMPQGGELRIALLSLHIERSGADKLSSDMVLLRVSDTGRGIPPSLLPHIFQHGVSGKKLAEDDREEHGLGLAVVRDLTVRAGGSVRVGSHGGPGACFEIELPAAHLSEWQKQLAAAHLPHPRRTAQPRGRQDGSAGRRGLRSGSSEASTHPGAGVRDTAVRDGVRRHRDETSAARESLNYFAT